MVKNILIVLLTLLLLSFGKSIERLENYRYANILGFCPLSEIDGLTDVDKRVSQEDCLNKTETRTSPIWHIYYALKDN